MSTPRPGGVGEPAGRWRRAAAWLALAAGSAAASTQLPAVPAAFHGEWNAQPEDCGTARNDSRLRIDADRIRFHESEGPVIGVERASSSDILVSTRLTGESRSWTSTRRLRLAEDGSTLRDVTEGPAGLLRHRCPTTAEAALQLLDPAIPPAVAGREGWNYQQSALADLDGDGRPERVVLTARVELVRGRPAWDDGQPWQVYVEEADGSRTRVYAQRLQLGTLTMRVTQAQDDSPATVVLLEHLPDRLALYEVRYTGRGRVSITTHFRKAMDPRGDTASPRLP